MTSQEGSSTERELQLIEKLEFRIILNSNDESKLQDTLTRYLRALLLKVESPDEAVRSRTILVAQRINGYIKAPGVVLPVKELLAQLKATESLPLKTIDLMFMQHSLMRLTPAERRSLAPELMCRISRDSRHEMIAAGLVNCIFQLLPDINIPPRGSLDDDNFRQSIGLDRPGDAAWLAGWFGKLMILRPAAMSPEDGITKADYDFLTRGRGAAAWSTDPTAGSGSSGLALPLTRRLVMAFLASGAFTDAEKFFPAVRAAGSSDPLLASAAEDILRRTTSSDSISLEDGVIVAELFAMHAASSRPVRIRLLALLSKSVVAATNETHADDILAVASKNIVELVAFYKQRAVNLQDEVQTRAAKQDGGAVREHAKLATATLSFLLWVAKMNAATADADAKGSRVGAELLPLVWELLQAVGWPAANVGNADDSLRVQLYEVLGAMARSARLKGAEKIIWVQRLLRSLAEDPQLDVVVSLEGALSGMGRQFSADDYGQFDDNRGGEEDVHMEGTEGPRPIREMLRFYMNVDETVKGSGAVRNVRHAVTKFVNDCMPTDDVEARWFDILAIAGREGERSDVVEEGRRGLDLWSVKQRSSGRSPLPKWEKLVEYFFAPVDWVQDSENAVGSLAKSYLDRHFLSAAHGGTRRYAVAEALKYCRNILFATVLQDFRVERNWEFELENRVKHQQRDRQKLRSYASSDGNLSSHQKEMLTQLIYAALEGVLRLKVNKPQEECLCILAEMMSVSSTIPHGESALGLMPLLHSNSDLIRTTAATVLGMIASQRSVSGDNLEKHFVQPLLHIALAEGAVGSQQNGVEGAYRALGHVLANRKYYKFHTLEGPSVQSLSDLVAKMDIFQLQPSMKAAILDMLTDLWTAFIPVGLADVKQPEIMSRMIEALMSDAKKRHEKAIKALGRLCIAIDDRLCTDPEITCVKIIDGLLDLTDIKEVEVHLAIGEALAASVARWESSAVLVGLNLDVLPTTRGHVTSRVEYLLQKLLGAGTTTKPSILKAYGIWLFSLIQYCHELPPVKDKFRDFQRVFMRLLSARDELVQETASRGLSLVFEKGDESTRKTLVSDLTAVLTGDAKDRLKVDEESEVFRAGDLETQDGKSITSYKDVVSLATEAGDPSLVYKLMNMSIHAATWSTRSAFGQFGLGSILSEALLPPILYAKLYRYRFDPVSTVRKNMTQIWNAAVKDSAATVNEHFDLIIKELVESLFAKEWRSREASCAAITDLLTGRRFQDYHQYYDEIWRRAAKVLDDKKGTVRTAALKLCMSLSKSLVSQLEISPESAASKDMMAAAIPFLLSDKALGSDVKEVFAVSATTLINIAKHGGKGLKPHACTIILELLGVMSSSESENINYARNKLGADMAEKLDEMRSAYSSKSPLWEAIENVLRTADRDVLDQLMPRFEEVVKTTIGLPTKLGCSHLIVALVSRHAEDTRPHAAMLLKLMRKQVFDKNNQVGKAYARSSAYLFKIAKPKSRELFATNLVDHYFKAESEGPRERVAEVVLALSKLASDQFRAMEALVLPLVFVGKHDTDQVTRRIMSEIWDDNAGSDRAVARVLEETAALIDRGIETNQLAVRHGAALAAASLVEALAGMLSSADADHGQISIQRAQLVWPVLEKSLALKTFEDKGKVVEAFATLVASCPELWRENPEIAARHEIIAMREAKRPNVSYKTQAMPALARFATARTDLDLLQDIIALAKPILDEAAASRSLAEQQSGSRSAPDSDEVLRVQQQSKLIESLVKAICTGYNRCRLCETPATVLATIVDALLPYIQSGGGGSGDGNDGNTSLQLVDPARRAWYIAVTPFLEEASAAVNNVPLSSLLALFDPTDQPSTSGGRLFSRYAESLTPSTPDINKQPLPLDGRMDRAKAFAALAKATVAASNALTTKALTPENSDPPWGARHISLNDERTAVRDAGRRLLDGERAADVRRELNLAVTLLED